MALSSTSLAPFFTRASAAYDYDATGTLVQFATNTPRIGNPAGALIEGAGANNRTNSNDFTAGAYIKVQASIVPGATTGPDGVAGSASLLAENATLNSHYMALTSPTNYSGSTQYTTSVYMAYAGRQFVNLSVNSPLNSTGASIGQVFDLLNGVLGASTGTNQGARIEPVGFGFYRCSLTFTTVASPASGNLIVQFGTGNNFTSSNYLGDGVSGVYLFGCQNEPTYYASSYMPAAGSNGTRTADFLTIGGATFSQIFGAPSSGVLIADVQMDAASAIQRNIFQLDDGTASNRVELRPSVATPTSLVGAAIVGGTSTITPAQITSAFSYGSSVSRVGIRWTSGGMSICSNGGTLATATGTFPVGVTNLRFGSAITGNAFNGRIRGVWAGPFSPSDAKFQAACTLGADVDSALRT
jgi:hypothetical protein